jgi:hypothetical protein
MPKVVIFESLLKTLRLQQRVKQIGKQQDRSETSQNVIHVFPQSLSQALVNPQQAIKKSPQTPM